ncbi:MAG TPA: hypothetical protein VHU86_00135 [Solirubrobacterales bacterium]|jgi:hypothetical protein|nr:hypothetical protein [Solirubrobacterales bacterium]
MKRIAVAMALLFVLVSVPRARATSDPLGSGTTRLAFEKSFLAFLRRDKVKLSTTSPAALKGKVASFPVSGGLIDPTIGRGTIETEGSIVFANARGRIPLRAITVKTDHSPLIAKVGGSQLKLATSAKIASKREGFGSGFQAKQLKLTAKVATRLNKKLRPRVPFAAGQAIGSTASATQPQTVTVLAQNKATIAFDPAFVSKLLALPVPVALNPVFPAEHEGASFTFPIIVGSAIAPDASQGTIRTGGEVELLALGAGQIFWHEQWLAPDDGVDLAEVNLQPAPPFGGKQAQAPLFSLSMAGAQVASDPVARTVAISGTSLALEPAAAAQMNELFAQGKAVFAASEAIGSFSVTAQGQ